MLDACVCVIYAQVQFAAEFDTMAAQRRQFRCVGELLHATAWFVQIVNELMDASLQHVCDMRNCSMHAGPGVPPVPLPCMLGADRLHLLICVLPHVGHKEEGINNTACAEPQPSHFNPVVALYGVRRWDKKKKAYVNTAGAEDK
jgi:hypothetical protein